MKIVTEIMKHLEENERAILAIDVDVLSDAANGGQVRAQLYLGYN